MTLRIAAAGMALALAACSLPVVDKQADAAARGLYEEIRTGAELAKDPNLGPPLKSAEALAQLAEIRTHIPAGPPAKVENRSFNFSTSPGGSSATLVHAYKYPGGTVLADTYLEKAPGQKDWQVVGFHVKVEPKGGGEAPVTVTTEPAEKT